MRHSVLNGHARQILVRRIADLDAATCVRPVPLHRTQQLAGRTSVRIGCAVIAEVLEAEAACLLEQPVALRRRHIGLDAVVLARLQFGAAVITFVGQYLQCLRIKGLFGSFCHRIELVDVAAVVHHFARNN